jgi:NTE family protein
MTRLLEIVASCVIAATAWSTCAAQERAPVGQENSRPRIGLALSGGGARGGAHVGVLRALRELGIPIDYIAGTSMGAVIGGLYASGLDEEELATVAGDIDWSSLFNQQPDRDDRSFHRKRDDRLYLVKQRAGFNNGNLELPMGILQGQDIDLLLTKLTMPVAHVDNFDDFPIPFRAVAADIVTGEAVILDHGALGSAVRASLSIPAVFAPVEIDGQLLVDGGIAQNLPVDAVRSMGADIVIAVDISTPLAGREALTSVLGIANQLTGFLTTRGTAAQVAKLGPRDVLIRPDLKDITTSSFERVTDTFDIGYVATMAMASELRALALLPEAYAAHRAARANPRVEDLPQIDFVRVAGDTRLADNIVMARLEDIPLGQPLDFDATESAIARVTGLDLFQNVGYSVVEQDGRTGLEVDVQDRSWGPNYLQGGLEYGSIGDDENLFGLSLSHLRTAMNDLGAEWRSTIKIGDEPAISTEWHQPLGWNAMTFVSAGLKWEAPLVNLYADDGTALAQIQVPEVGVDISAGREFGTWGELRFGFERGAGSTELRTGNPALVNLEDFERGDFYTRLSIDTLDTAYIPTGGAAVQTAWILSREDLGAHTKFDQVTFSATVTRSFGKHIITGALRFDTTTDGIAPPSSLFKIGGFWDLAGLAPNELTGQHAGRFLAAYYRRFGPSARLPLFAGIAYEKGNAWSKRSEISMNNTIDSRSIWLGAETPIGPVYISYGTASGDRDSVSLSVGRAL